MYGYGLIGNCQASALISKNASIDWLCFPRPDSPPVFGKLLDPEGGAFTIDPLGEYTCSQEYVTNTNVLVTRFDLADGSSYSVTDFCPRFVQHGRNYRPVSLFRVVKKLEGTPRIRVVCQPVSGWDKRAVRPVRGNSHLRWEIRGEKLRLTTDMSLTYLDESIPFTLDSELHFGLTWGSAIEDDLSRVSNRFLDETIEYWKGWVKHCSIPTLYQKQTIRSALALKLHVYEDTGAILAALTTSLPEEVESTRNWDYRFCWLRDSYYVLSAFRNLGHFEEMEGFLKFLLNLAHHHEHSRDRLAPVYTLDQALTLPEKSHEQWAGFEGSKPVRSMNQAGEHIQNDVYGEMILTLAPIFLDERFRHLRTRSHEDLIANLARQCAKTVGQPDAGLWEIRDGWREHTFTNLMCWAGLSRIQKIREAGYLGSLDLDLSVALKSAEAAIYRSTQDGIVRNGPGDLTLDASLLQLPLVRFPDRELSNRTVEAISRELGLTGEGIQPGFLYRYLREDDFGRPQSAFMICSFWLVQALAALGKKEEAIEAMNTALSSANELGLLAEHYIPHEKLQRGNFPQAYSHVGQINAAFAVSPPWDDVI